MTVNFGAGFATNGLRITYPLVSAIVNPVTLTLVSPLLRSISDYARKSGAHDLVIGYQQIRSISRFGLLLGLGVDIELDNGATFGLWTPKGVRALNVLTLPESAWNINQHNRLTQSSRSSAPIRDLRQS